MKKNKIMTPKKILLIEDDPTQATLIRKILKVTEYEIFWADTGKKGLEMFDAENPDLVLLDIVLPDIDGFKICKKIRTLKQKYFPILFLTAHTENNKLTQGFKAGASDYITKPFNRETLLARIKNQFIILEMQDGMEQVIEDRTSELQQTVEKLKKEVINRKIMEKDLQRKNSALQEILAHFSEEKKRIQKEILDNIEALIVPHLDKMRLQLSALGNKQVDAFESAIVQLKKNFIGKNENLLRLLTPQEYEICNLIRNGIRSKEIAELLNITTETVKWHRKNIRKKLELDNHGERLEIYLRQQ